MSRVPRHWLVAAALAGIAFAAFVPALGCEFVNYDDPDYVTRNGQVTAGLSPARVGWAFTTFKNGNWHPLTWLSLQLDATLWHLPNGKPNPLGFHLTSVLLHAANAALLFLALRALTGADWRSAAVALLFAVHPLRVESVAWVTERKDVLSTFFGLLALWAYAAYVAAPSTRRYLALAGLFALSLLSKPMLVTLPCLLLVLDWWPLGRLQAGNWRPRVVEKLPLFALVVASSVVTYLAQSTQSAVASTTMFPPSVRLENALVGYSAYLFKTVWPVDLAAYYPHPIYDTRPGGGLTGGNVGLAVVLLLALTAGAVALRRRAPYLLAGWLWFLGTLVPVLGLVQVGAQAYADRYSYFPQIGILLAVCWGAADLARGRERLALAAGVAAALALAVVTQSQTAYWKNSEALWRHSLQMTFPNSTAEMNLGEVLEQKKDFKGAVERYRKAVACEQGSVAARFRLGKALGQLDRLDEAVKQYEEVLRLQPDFVEARVQLGISRFGQGLRKEALDILADANLRAPESSTVLTALGLVLEGTNNPKLAAEKYEEAVECDPKNADAWFHMGRTRPRRDEAIKCFKKALELDPDSSLYKSALENAQRTGAPPAPGR
jgi:tetratricopeptide (TPR) repeat protein